MRTYIARLWNDELGQSTAEYILILSVVVMVAMKFKQQFQGVLMQIVGNVSDQLSQATTPSQ